MSSFGPTLKEYREQRRETQSTLARKCGLAPSYLSRLESGTRDPSIPTVVTLADRLQLSRRDQDVLFGAAGYLRPGVMIVRSDLLYDIDRILGDPALHPVVRSTMTALLTSTRDGLAEALKKTKTGPRVW